MQVSEIQAQLRAQGLDGWLLFDHHVRDPIAYRVLGLDSGGARLAALVLLDSCGW